MLSYYKKLWLDNGGAAKAADTMARIGANESSGNASIADGVTGTHIGLWQISQNYAGTGENLRDPNINAQHAIKLYNQRIRAGGDGFSDWEASRHQGGYGGWGSANSTPSPAQTTSAEALAKRDTRTAATHEQLRPDPHLSTVAPYSTPTPGTSNPLGGPHSDALPAVMKYINDQLGIAGKGVTAAGTATANAFHPGAVAWGQLWQALQHGAEHGLQTFANVEGTLMRGVEAVHVDESNREAALVKKGVSPIPTTAMISPATAKAIIATAADYIQHPKNMLKTLGAMSDPSQAQMLTDTLEKNWASEMGMPAPEHWNTIAKVGASILTEGGHDPFSYVGFGEISAPIRAGMEALSHAHLGVGVADAVRLGLNAAAKTVAANKTVSAVKSIKAVAQGIDAVQETARLTSKAGKDFGKLVTEIRPDLDPHLTPEGKMSHIGLSEHVDTLINDRTKTVNDLFKAHPNLDKLNQFDKVPDDIKLDRLKTAYRYGSKVDAKKAERLAPQYNWTITAEERAHSAQGFVNYGDDFIAKPDQDFMKRIESTNTPKDKWSDTIRKDWKAPNTIDMNKTATGGIDPNQSWLDLSELRLQPGIHSMRDLLENSYQLENEAIRRGMLIKKSADLVTSVPGLMTPAAEAAIKLGTKKVHITATNFPNRFQMVQDARRDAAETYFRTQVPVKAPQVVGTGKIKTVLTGLRALSNVWKSSLAGTGLIVHSMRNVGAVATMLTGSPEVAATGLMRGIKGTPPALIDRMKAGGSYSSMWREMPKILQNLGVRMGAGGVVGGLAGNAAAPDNATPLEHLAAIGAGVGLGAGYGAGLNNMTELMDRFENGMRSAYLEHLDTKLGPVKNAAEEYARNAKVSQDLGGYTNTNKLVSYLQGMGGTFVAYRVGTVPRAALATLKHPGTISNAERAQQNIGAQLPANQGSDPSDLPVQLHALGPMDEAIEGAADPFKFFLSAATIGPAAGGFVQGLENKAYNKTHPQSLGQQATGALYGALGSMPGGAVVQNAVPGLSPYKDSTGLPIWAQELLHLTGVYSTKTNRRTEKMEQRGYARAEE
jgi:hypothetical protein